MRQVLVALLACALAACSAAPVKAPSTVSTTPDTMTVQQAFDGLRQEKGCEPYLAPAAELADSPQFKSNETKERQVEFLLLITRCAADLEQFQLAFEHADRAAALNPDIVWMQMVRLYFGMAYERTDASLDALGVLARIAPESVRGMDLDSVNHLLRAARDADESGDRLLAAYEALERSGYVLPAPYYPDTMRVDHARLLLARDRVADARLRLVGIVDIESVVEMRVDRRYDVLRGDPAFDSQLDVAAAARRDVARSRGAMQANPTLMEAVYIHAMVLLTAMRDEEGLAVVQAALDRDAADAAAFTDGDDFRNWVINVKGYYLYNLGRVEEGGAALREAAGLQERGDPNVSNIINYGGYLLLEGRAREALELVPRIGEPSPYGRGWIEWIKACAGVQLEDAGLQSSSLEFLRSHEDDNPAALSRTFLCANDIDGAAAVMIRRLENPETRSAALRALQVTPLRSDKGLPYRKLMNQRFAVLRDRTDVRAAAEKVGRIESLPVDIVGD